MQSTCSNCGSKTFEVIGTNLTNIYTDKSGSFTFSSWKRKFADIYAPEPLVTVNCSKCKSPRLLYYNREKHLYHQFRPITKSRFLLGLDCPTKLYYQDKQEYPNLDHGNEFVQSLAEGGCQIGKLAKLYYPDGKEISKTGYTNSINETIQHFTKHAVTLFEAAFQHENLFIRADIIIKNGDNIDLIEVKSKSISNNDSSVFTKGNGDPKKEWKSYLFDVAFQKYVLNRALPNYRINSYLMLADKSTEVSVNGLNQQFLIEKSRDGQALVNFTGDRLNPKIGRPILAKVDVNDIVNDILAKLETDSPSELQFENLVKLFSNNYRDDKKIEPILGTKCKKCEFKSEENKSGFKECWEQAAKFSEEDFQKPLTLELWGAYMQDRKDVLIKSGKYFLADLRREDIAPNEKPYTKPGLSHIDRKMLQIKKATKGETDSYWDIQGLAVEFSKFTYPLHFIDFETSAVAIPFTINRSPYEGVAFQYSHHILHENGVIRHQGQYLNSVKGAFPNFDFIRALKSELENDLGTIFRWAPHENTYLNIIHNQLIEYSKKEIPDRDELIQFIQLVSHSKEKSIEKWAGDRDMVDLWDLEKKYYYNPATKGSNSIKDVLPAVLMESTYLQNKYSKPVYGKKHDITSLNFNEVVWIQYDEDGQIINPYHLLPHLFEGVDEERMQTFISDSNLSDGGAAMTAYAKMQFTEMSPEEKILVELGLLKYCELDTLAMVMIFEHWSAHLAKENSRVDG
jgi:hypothetical protein